MKQPTALGEAIAYDRRIQARYKRAARILRDVCVRMYDYELEYILAAQQSLGSPDTLRKLRRLTRAKSVMEHCRARLVPLTTALAATRRVAFGVG